MLKNINFNLKFISFLLFSIIFLLIFLLSLNNYPSNKILYSFFTLASFSLLIISLNKNSFFFEKFFSIYLFLGFWFKFSFLILFSEGNEYIFAEGVGKIIPSELNKPLFIASIFFIFFSLLILFRIKIFNSYNFFFKLREKKELLFKSKFIEITLVISFAIFCLLLSIINFNYNIFQKGMPVPLQFNNIFVLILKWFFLVGFISIISILLFNKIKRSKKNLLMPVLYSLILIFIYNISLLSRAMIFDFVAIIFGIVAVYKNELSMKKFDFFLIFFFSIILFLSSIFVINEIRLSKNIIQPEKKTNLKILDERKNFYLDELRVLIFNRFVGIDSLINVAKSKNLSLKLLIDSTKYKNKDKGFYENEFLIENESENNLKNYNIIVPGIIAYLYYSGSIILIIALFFTIYLFMIFLEFLTSRLSNNNLILTSVIGNILAYRLIHFGYMPYNSYQIILAVLIVICIYPILKYFFKTYV